MTEPVRRPAARVVLLSPSNRVLLFRTVAPGEGGVMWITPGGALLPGEAYEEGARRELREEVGLEEVPLSPCVWTREHVFRWRNETHRAVERFFVVRAPGEVVDTSRFDSVEIEEIDGYRWWSLEELSRADEMIVPRRLAELLAPILEGRLPETPIDTGP